MVYFITAAFLLPETKGKTLEEIEEHFDISVSGANANGALGDGYLRFVNVGRFLKLPTDAFTVRVGQFELDSPFTQARSINLSPYDIYTQMNINLPQTINNQTTAPSVNNMFALQNGAQGIEFSGGHQYGGYHYSLAVVNQNTSGNTSPATNVSSPGGFFSDSNYKRCLRPVFLPLQPGERPGQSPRRSGCGRHRTT